MASGSGSCFTRRADSMDSLKSIIINVPKSKEKSLMTAAFRELTALPLSTAVKANLDSGKNVKRAQDIRSEGGALFMSQVCIRGKKRRLDHLTWEEKVQRKKLKNRVAAQTSRDRKKAKLDELEETVKDLKDRNESLVRECVMLRSQNESLMSEVTRLTEEKGKTAVLRRISSILEMPSAAGRQFTIGTTSDQDHNPLPPLEELFTDLQEDDYIERLEKLAESLLREVTTDERALFAEDSNAGPETPRKMVGKTSENVETRTKEDRTVNIDVLRVNNGGFDSGRIVKQNAPKKQEETTRQNNTETIYGSYDEKTNCITIICPPTTHENEERKRVTIEECVQEAGSHQIEQNEDAHYLNVDRTTFQRLSPAYTSMESMSSPSSVRSEDIDIASNPAKNVNPNVSDFGYESHDSPAVADCNTMSAALTDLWHESFSELFPSLA